MPAPLMSPAGGPPALWDPIIRLSHWALAIVVLVNAVLTRGGSALHVWVGWIGLGVLALRLIWGLVGTREARFSSFPPQPLAALRHLGELARGTPRQYGSHNPAGAMMVYALWGAMAVVMATGLVMTGGKTPVQVSQTQSVIESGDWTTLAIDDESGDDDSETDAGGKQGGLAHLAEELHEVAANLILFLAFLHVAGVFVESRVMRKNLTAAMLTGRSDNRGA
ncbi:cytochrome b/b6 domain-containing protein [Rhodobacter sp. Har01]|uniref:cytochrome b/b6 domain-containing protein n=1 Tax=Rhodobacter sp. Har01 TaxID=2883999 RepID=UPI001D098D80|nr:cytochrome b/b6 domain-containing protein [Rhodobacter sp. Har01]MCB6178757.1 cytochrome b/b6 domain-containing protein [Rhodobacter sp. Har01]